MAATTKIHFTEDSFHREETFLSHSWLRTLRGRFNRQEAQLSQRDRATLSAIEYFAKSLKITQGHSK